MEETSIDMYRHIHILADSTWLYAGLVQKIPHATRAQTQKNIAKTKQSPSLKQTCGTLKTAKPK